MNRDIKKIKYIEDTFTISNFSSTFGFTQKTDYENTGDEYYYVSSDMAYKPVLVKGYDYFFPLEPYGNTMILDGYEMKLKNMTTLIITKDNKTIFEEDLTNELTRILSLKIDNEKEFISLEESLINHSGSNDKIKIYLKELSTRKPDGDAMKFENVSLNVLFTP